MKVPVSNVVQMPQAPPKINPTMLAMAGALMHQEGKFNVPDEGPKTTIRFGPKDEDVVNFKRSDELAGYDERQRRLMDPKRKPDIKAPELTPEEAEDIPGRRIP